MRKSACVRCKQLKVRCDKPHDGPCDRCLRIGISCVASISRQGKRPQPGNKEGQGQAKVVKLARTALPQAQALPQAHVVPHHALALLSSQRFSLSALLAEWQAAPWEGSDILRGLLGSSSAVKTCEIIQHVERQKRVG